MVRVVLMGSTLAFMLFSTNMTRGQSGGRPAPEAEVDRATDGDRWYSDYGAALDRARRTHRPLMVVFRCVP